MTSCKLRRLATASLSFLALTFSVRATDLTNSITGSVSDGSASIPYRLFEPSVTPGQKVPLILFLHGMGDRGTDNIAQTYWMNQLQANTASGKDAAYVLAPQISQSMWFASSTSQQTEAESLTMQALKAAEQNPNIDTSRIYLTGVSMGSFGAWDLLRFNPNLFAAAVPMSGGGDPSTAAAIGKTPVWAFHGSADSVVSVQTTRDMVAALQAAGGNVKYTEVAGGGHTIWPQVYSDPSLYDWLFAQHLGADPTSSIENPISAPVAPPTVASVPEPTSMGLIAMVGLTLLVRRSARKTRRIQN